MIAPYAARLRVSTDAHPSVPLPWEELERQLREVHGGTEVLLVGGEPALSPHLLRLIREVRARGAAPVLVTAGAQLGSAERVSTLISAGLAELAVRVEDPAPADRGAKTPFGRAMRALEIADGRLVRSVVATGAAGAPWVPLAASCGGRLRLLHPAEGVQLASEDEDQALDAAWRAALAAGVELVATGWLTPLLPVARSEAPPLGGGIEGLMRAGWVPRSARGGLRHTDVRLARLLGPAGAPSLDLPACEGGVGTRSGLEKGAECAACPADAGCGGSPHPAPRPPPPWRGCAPQARVAVIVPDLPDQVQVISTLPALAAALAARGLDVRLRTAWDAPFSPDDLRAPFQHPAWKQLLWSAGSWWLGRRDPRQIYLPPREKLGHPLRWTEPPHRRRSVMAGFWESLDLRGEDVVIVPGHAAAQVLAHPTLPAAARVIVVDDHMLAGVEDLRGPWDRVEVHACFPGYAWLYDRAGVPLDRVTWRPYPLHLRHFAPYGPPAASETIFCGGWHHRDGPTMVAAAARLRSRPVEVIADAVTAQAGPLVLRGTTDLPTFVDAVRRARFVVLPLRFDPTKAAGITVLAMAFAAGRPVVATATQAMRDHVREGVDGLLVPPGDPAALAEAIERLDRDTTLLHRLAAGARAAGARHSVEAWADQIVHGAPPRAVIEDVGWRAW